MKSKPKVVYSYVNEWGEEDNKEVIRHFDTYDEAKEFVDWHEQDYADGLIDDLYAVYIEED